VASSVSALVPVIIREPKSEAIIRWIESSAEHASRTHDIEAQAPRFMQPYTAMKAHG
jgi:hypothetical protein